jgi:hypothetical protein
VARKRPPLRPNGGSLVQTGQPTFLPPPDGDYVRDWTTLAVGDDVHILTENTVHLSGRVDTITHEGEILWLHLSAGEGRKLFLRSENVAIWRIRSDGKGS